MGMSYTGFGAPVTVKNLKVNADLDLGNYDLTATDVKGDTAEFDEFVGGVGNFTNVLGSGNLDIEGTGNIKGLTTFQNAVQVNGSLHVEGSINNVNIADNGEITTSQGVNGADFNGATITSTKFNGATISSTKFNGATINTSGDYSGRKGTFSGAVTGTSFNSIPIKTSGTITVTPTSTYYNIPSSTDKDSGPIILPFLPGSATYTGSINVQMQSGSSGNALVYSTDKVYSGYVSIDVGGTYTISFTGVKWLRVSYARSGLIDYCKISGFTLS